LKTVLETNTCRSVLKSAKDKDQRVGESLQELATAVDQLAHRASPGVPDDQVRRKADKAFGNGTGDRSVKRKLFLGSKRALNEALRQALELEVAKLIVGSYIRLQKTSMGEPAPSQTKEETISGLRTGILGASATSGSSVLTDRKKK
jgi:hypothetical protein